MLQKTVEEDLIKGTMDDGITSSSSVSDGDSSDSLSDKQGTTKRKAKSVIVTQEVSQKRQKHIYGGNKCLLDELHCNHLEVENGMF